ncbi:putative ankyrin repeat protein [Lachnellula occidentalis]|uniref:Putative ankyrin repeat protein n=1 Tax=Lachnellula occidentalis TaxID=215460 RepID=A0A8H8RUJ1_9HELO|nr:putative ankyrin repeat protein [Lachnellula occidentalis]
MADTATLSQQQRQEQMMRNARQQQMQIIQQQQQQQQSMGSINSNTFSQPPPPQPMQYQLQPMQLQSTTTGNTMGSAYDDLPIMDLKDLGLIGQEQADCESSESFKTVCRDGPFSTVQTIVSSAPRTPIFLHQGLVSALSTGNIETARYLLSAGAPIVRQTPNSILSAPSDQQVPLFTLLSQHGWSPNTPGYYGAVLLPSVVTKLPLLRWFLAHGADPNFGEQRDDRMGGPKTDSCAALEAASGRGDVEAVCLLLDAGAEIRNGACPPGTNPHTGRIRPSKEFDESRIPVMALLVERGADVNQIEESQHMVARYAIVHAVMAGAVERVKWLLERGADPEVRGPFGSAVECAKSVGSEEMRRVIAKGITVRRGFGNLNET